MHKRFNRKQNTHYLDLVGTNSLVSVFDEAVIALLAMRLVCFSTFHL